MKKTFDFKEIAQYCIDQVKQECTEHPQSQHGYMTALYIAILPDNQIRVSKTPHILDGAKRCYIVHKWSQLASTIWYAAYKIHSISETGEVGEGELDEKYSFRINWAHFNCPEEIVLKRDGETIYSASLWNRGQYILSQEVSFLWEFYNKCKEECSTILESKLLSKLAKKEQKIEVLEKALAESSIKEEYLKAEIGEYRYLLDKIQQLVEEKNDK